jgi:hypothetical protein
VASAAPPPQPMLARGGPIQTRGDWAFEVKWDGFRAIVSTEGSLSVRSRFSSEGSGRSRPLDECGAASDEADGYRYVVFLGNRTGKIGVQPA